MSMIGIENKEECAQELLEMYPGMEAAVCSSSGRTILHSAVMVCVVILFDANFINHTSDSRC